VASARCTEGVFEIKKFIGDFVENHPVAVAVVAGLILFGLVLLAGPPR
jgi:hypothetical protein